MGETMLSADGEREIPLPVCESYDELREMLTALSDDIGEYQGVPVPVDDLPLRLCEGHPLKAFYVNPPVEVEVLVGGPAYEEDISEDETTEQLLERASNAWLAERVVNEWYDPKHNRQVYIFKKSNGRAFAMTAPRPPDRSMERLNLALQTLTACDAWSLEAEATAIEKLASHITYQQLRTYMLTGIFVEMSKRSGLTYVFRRLRPTICLTPRKGETMHVLAVLCLHPIGYYDQTWAGCMVPTDDVLAHLLMMRGDEHLFWRKANQHDSASPEAGL